MARRIKDYAMAGDCHTAALISRDGSIDWLRNDVGLLPEEYDVAARRYLGDFPQAFSHIGLINSARNLEASGGPAENRKQHSDSGQTPTSVSS